MEIPKKQSSYFHQLKILETIPYQKLFQKECKAGQFMLGAGLSWYFRLTNWRGVSHFPHFHLVDQAMWTVQDCNGVLFLLSMPPKLKIIKRIHCKPSRSTFFNYLYSPVSSKISNSWRPQLKINFVQGVLLQPDLSLYG